MPAKSPASWRTRAAEKANEVAPTLAADVSESGKYFALRIITPGSITVGDDSHNIVDVASTSDVRRTQCKESCPRHFYVFKQVSEYLIRYTSRSHSMVNSFNYA